LRRKGSGGLCFYLLLLLTSPGWMMLSMKGRNYALASVLILLALIVGTSRIQPLKKWYGFVALSALAVLTRYSAVFFLLPLAWIPIMELRDGSKRLLHMVIAFGVAGILLQMISFGDWPAFWFWTVEYHLHSQVSVDRWHQLAHFALLSPVAWVMVVYGIGKQITSRSLNRWNLMISFGLVLAVLVNLLPERSYGEYSAIYVPALCFFLATRFPEGFRFRLTGGYYGIAAISIGLFLAVLASEKAKGLISFGALDRFQKAQVYVDEYTEPGDWACGSALELLTDSRLSIPNRLSMGIFSVSELLESERVDRLGLLNHASLMTVLQDPKMKLLAFYSKPERNFRITVPEIRAYPEEYTQRMETLVKQEYQVIYQDPDYTLWLRRN